MKEKHILELSKFPPEEKNETSLLQWMRFLGGKTRKDFEKMAKKNSELEEAYDVLDKLSADEKMRKKRLEYETTCHLSSKMVESKYIGARDIF